MSRPSYLLPKGIGEQVRRTQLSSHGPRATSNVLKVRFCEFTVIFPRRCIIGLRGRYFTLKTTKILFIAFHLDLYPPFCLFVGEVYTLISWSVPSLTAFPAILNIGIVLEILQYNIEIKIPYWLDNMMVSLVLLYRWVGYGYAFRKIPLTQGKYAVVDPKD